MNLPDFKNINSASLQNFSVDGVRTFINNRKPEALTIAIVLGMFFLGHYLFSEQLKVIAELKEQAVALSEKETPVSKLKKSLDVKKDYLLSLPPALTEDNFITLLSEQATTYGLRIMAYKPPVVKAGPFFKKFSVNLELSAPGFKAAMLFLTSLEHLDKSIRVDSWSMASEKKDNTSGLKLKVIVVSYQVNSYE